VSLNGRVASFLFLMYNKGIGGDRF